jgi:hypothetical protein
MRSGTAAFFSLLMLSALMAIGQNYDWQKERRRFDLDEKESRFAEYRLLFHRSYDYTWVNKELEMVLTEHVITRVTNNESIQRHNRIYVSLRGVQELLDIKARSINKNGKVVFFDKKNLKEIKDEDSDNSYKIFAIEGVEADAEIEYYYRLIMDRKVYETVYVQHQFPIRKFELLVTCPKAMTYQFKAYHDTTRVKTDTLNRRNRYNLTMLNIPGLPEESFSSYNASRKRIEFKLAYNFSSSSARLNTWVDAAKIFYRQLVGVESDDQKAVEKYARAIGDNPSWATVKRIRNVEENIKKTISISSKSAYTKVTDVLKFQQANAAGVTRLLLLTYNQLGMNPWLVITCNREIAHFDGSFDTWSYLDEYLIYFPESNGFLSPGEQELRYPLIDPKYSAHDGLFIEPVTVGKIKSAIGKVRPIPQMPYNTDSDNLNISVKFSEDLDAILVNQKRGFVGLDAAALNQFYSQMNQEQRAKYIEELMKQSFPDLKISTWTVDTTPVDLLPGFVINTTFTSDHFVERAGPRILFKAGELIGRQSELYSENERVTDVENTRNRSYDRTITIEIPNGYTLNNAELLRIHTEYKDGDKIPFAFHSDYTIKGNVLTITIEEFYKEIYAPRSRYEDFRKVVNAAADFNKVTLVLEKK